MAGFLNVGEMGSLALHELVELAKLKIQDPDARMTIQEIAARLEASGNTLQKVTRRLIAMGLIEGTRGAGGGVRLAVEPQDVTLLEVLEGLEGKVKSNGCLFSKRVCNDCSKCMFRILTENMETQVREYFTTTTLLDLLAQNETDTRTFWEKG